MPSRLTRNAQIQAVLPLALAEGWSVRKLAATAGIGYASAGALLRSTAQHLETCLDSETGAACSPVVSHLRESVANAAHKLAVRLERLSECVDSPTDAEKLAKALETAARVADNLDGLEHARALQRDWMRSGKAAASMEIDHEARPSSSMELYFSHDNLKC